MTTAAKILNLAVERNLSPLDLARTIGVHQSTVSKWKTGHLRPNSRHVTAISREFGVPVEWLNQDDLDWPPPGAPTSPAPLPYTPASIILDVVHVLGLSAAEAIRRLARGPDPTRSTTP